MATDPMAGIGLDEVAHEIAQNLLGRPADLTRVHGGGNNRVYRAVHAGGSHALKLYAPPGTAAADAKARLHQEFDGLAYLRANGIDAVPAGIAVNRDALAALYEWVEGKRPALLVPAERQADDIYAAIRFVSGLHDLSRHKPIGFTDAAREACLSGADLLAQVEQRLAALDTIAGESELQAFLAEAFRPTLAHAGERLITWAAATGSAFDTKLPRSYRILSPSDFGFHNALRRHDGKLIFIDFEYFGWDDPVKLLADFVWHPAMVLSHDERTAYLGDNLARLAFYDPHLPGRFNAHFPLYGLRWAAILLNEFFPERWQRRIFAGKGDASAEAWTAAKARQLCRAQHYLQIAQASSKTPAHAQIAVLLELLAINQ